MKVYYACIAILALAVMECSSPVESEAAAMQTASEAGAGPGSSVGPVAARIDLSGNTVPIGFAADSPRDLYERLTAGVPVKDEFETRAAFEERLRNVPQDSALYFFVMPFDSRASLPYDAERQRFTFAPQYNIAEVFDGYFVSAKKFDNSKCIWQLGLEKPTIVDGTVLVDEFCLYLGEPFKTRECQLTWSWPATAEAARVTKPRINNMLIAFRSAKHDSRQQTFVVTRDVGWSMNPPRNAFVKERCIAGVLLAVWLFDSTSGTVYFKAQL